MKEKIDEINEQIEVLARQVNRLTELVIGDEEYKAEREDNFSIIPLTQKEHESYHAENLHLETAREKEMLPELKEDYCACSKCGEELICQHNDNEDHITSLCSGCV